jgi:hypothetical protein
MTLEIINRMLNEDPELIDERIITRIILPGAVSREETASSLPDAFADLTSLDYVKYIFYYLIGAGLFILWFQRIRSAIMNYGASSAATEQ